MPAVDISKRFKKLNLALDSDIVERPTNIEDNATIDIVNIIKSPSLSTSKLNIGNNSLDMENLAQKIHTNDCIIK